MKTAVLVDSGHAGWSQQTIPLVLEPVRKPARKPKRIVVPFSGARPDLEAPDARIEVPRPGVWAWLELGFLVVLIASVSFLVILSVAAAGAM
jgi:hypothetical protein